MFGSKTRLTVNKCYRSTFYVYTRLRFVAFGEFILVLFTVFELKTSQFNYVICCFVDRHKLIFLTIGAPRVTTSVLNIFYIVHRPILF